MLLKPGETIFHKYDTDKLSSIVLILILLYRHEYRFYIG